MQNPAASATSTSVQTALSCVFSRAKVVEMKTFIFVSMAILVGCGAADIVKGPCEKTVEKYERTVVSCEAGGRALKVEVDK
jgi:hypothetical protein